MTTPDSACPRTQPERGAGVSAVDLLHRYRHPHPARLGDRMRQQLTLGPLVPCSPDDGGTYGCETLGAAIYELATIELIDGYDKVSRGWGDADTAPDVQGATQHDVCETAYPPLFIEPIPNDGGERTLLHDVKRKDAQVRDNIACAASPSHCSRSIRTDCRSMPRKGRRHMIAPVPHQLDGGTSAPGKISRRACTPTRCCAEEAGGVTA